MYLNIATKNTTQIKEKSNHTCTTYSAQLSLNRKCELSKKGLTNAAVDIMYIDLQRRWDHMNPGSSTTCKPQGQLLIAWWT